STVLSVPSRRPVEEAQARTSSSRNGADGFTQRVREAVRSWTSPAIIGTALTVGGIVGVYGTVTLRPGGQVSLTNTSLPLAINSTDRDLLQKLALSVPPKIELSSIENDLKPLSEAITELSKNLTSDSPPQPAFRASIANLSGSIDRLAQKNVSLAAP